MDIATLPLVSTPLDYIVRRVGDEFFLYAENEHAFLAGNRKIMRATIDLIDRVLHVHRFGTDVHGMRPQKVVIYHVVPGQLITLWLLDLQGLQCRVRVWPDWLRRIRPVLEIALKEADEAPTEERLYRACTNAQGWRRIRTATECGSD